MEIHIAEAAISLAPDSWLTSNKIQEYQQKYGRKPLVDASKHQHLLQSIPKEQRLDRPDILHFGLLTLLGYSELFPDLIVRFSTSDRCFDVDPKTRLPRSQTRFYGILEQLLAGTYKGKYLSELPVQSFNPQDTVVFSSQGRPLQKQDFEKSCFVFGGFAHGFFQTPQLEKLPTVQLVPQNLELWTALSLFTNKQLQFHGY